MATDDRKKDTVPIRIRKDLVLRLKDYGNMHETYSDVIERLLSKKETEKEKADTKLEAELEKVM